MLTFLYSSRGNYFSWKIWIGPSRYYTLWHSSYWNWEIKIIILLLLHIQRTTLLWLWCFLQWHFLLLYGSNTEKPSGFEGLLTTWLKSTQKTWLSVWILDILCGGTVVWRYVGQAQFIRFLSPHFYRWKLKNTMNTIVFFLSESRFSAKNKGLIMIIQALSWNTHVGTFLY